MVLAAFVLQRHAMENNEHETQVVEQTGHVVAAAAGPSRAGGDSIMTDRKRNIPETVSLQPLEDLFLDYGIRGSVVSKLAEMGFTTNTLLSMSEHELDNAISAISEKKEVDLLLGETFGIRMACRAGRKLMENQKSSNPGTCNEELPLLPSLYSKMSPSERGGHHGKPGLKQGCCQPELRGFGEPKDDCLSADSSAVEKERAVAIHDVDMLRETQMHAVPRLTPRQEDQAFDSVRLWRESRIRGTVDALVDSVVRRFLKQTAVEHPTSVKQLAASLTATHLVSNNQALLDSAIQLGDVHAATGTVKTSAVSRSIIRLAQAGLLSLSEPTHTWAALPPSHQRFLLLEDGRGCSIYPANKGKWSSMPVDLNLGLALSLGSTPYSQKHHDEEGKDNRLVPCCQKGQQNVWGEEVNAKRAGSPFLRDGGEPSSGSSHLGADEGLVRTPMVPFRSPKRHTMANDSQLTLALDGSWERQQSIDMALRWRGLQGTSEEHAGDTYHGSDMLLDPKVARRRMQGRIRQARYAAKKREEARRFHALVGMVDDSGTPTPKSSSPSGGTCKQPFPPNSLMNRTMSPPDSSVTGTTNDAFAAAPRAPPSSPPPFPDQTVHMTDVAVVPVLQQLLQHSPSMSPVTNRESGELRRGYYGALWLNTSEDGVDPHSLQTEHLASKLGRNEGLQLARPVDDNTERRRAQGRIRQARYAAKKRAARAMALMAGVPGGVIS